MYKIILFTLLISSTFVYSQNYYYSSGGKIYITQEQNKYVISMNDSVTEKEVLDFLSQNGLSTSMQSLKSKYIIVESSRFNKEQIRNMVISGNIGKDVTNVYKNDSKTSEFAITENIVIKLKNEADLKILLEKYNLKNIEREWLGEKVYLLKTNQYIGPSFK